MGRMTAPRQADGKNESAETVPEATILGNIEFDFDVHRTSRTFRVI